MTNKKAVSPVIGVILMVAITVVLAAVLYVWVSGMVPSGGITPTITLSTVDRSVSGDQDGEKSISCMVVSVSRVDVKWADLDYTVLVNESVVDDENLNVEHEPDEDGYVSGGDTVTVTYNNKDLGDKTRVKLTMVYIPTGSTAAVWSVTCT